MMSSYFYESVKQARNITRGAGHIIFATHDMEDKSNQEAVQLPWRAWPVPPLCPLIGRDSPALGTSGQLLARCPISPVSAAP